MARQASGHTLLFVCMQMGMPGRRATSREWSKLRHVMHVPPEVPCRYGMDMTCTTCVHNMLCMCVGHALQDNGGNGDDDDDDDEDEDEEGGKQQ